MTESIEDDVSKLLDFYRLNKINHLIFLSCGTHNL